MRVRNGTGVIQVFGSPSFKAMPGVWYRVPEELSLQQAMFGYKHRLLEMQFEGDERDMLWKTADGTHVHWMSPFSLGDGYATAAENMVHALIRNGMKLFIQQCWFVSTDGLLPETVRMLKEPIPGIMRVGVCMATPGEFRKLPTPYRIGLTMYEADDPLKIHPEWAHDCQQVDMLVVPSSYCKQVFEKFVRVPVQVAPLAVNPLYCRPVLRKPKGTFTFVTWGTLSGRKAPLETIETFKKAFPMDKYPTVRLVFKTRLGVFGWGQNQLPGRLDDPRIKIINTASPGDGTDWLPQQVYDWLLGADAMLFLTKGEGFGMPPREAMATGLPTIFTNCTGMAEVANKRYNWPIPVGREEPSPLGGNWRLYKEEAAIETMRWMVENREEAYAKGLRGAEWFIRTWGPDAAGAALKDIIEGVTPESIRRPVASYGEAISKGNMQSHKPFYQMATKGLKRGAVVLDFGVGDGMLYVALKDMGFDVYGIVKPGTLEATAAKIKASGCDYKLAQYELLGVRPHVLKQLGIPQPDLVISQGVLQQFHDTEVNLVFQAMMACAPINNQAVWFSVPSVFYPDEYAEGSRLMRLGEWKDRFIHFVLHMDYYGGEKRYLWGRLEREGERNNQPVRLAGRIMDGVWHPREAHP